jgi:hypothetical protein
MEEKKYYLNQSTIDKILDLIDTAVHQRPYIFVRQVVEQIFKEINQQKAEEEEIKSENK